MNAFIALGVFFIVMVGIIYMSFNIVLMCLTNRAEKTINDAEYAFLKAKNEERAATIRKAKEKAATKRQAEHVAEKQRQREEMIREYRYEEYFAGLL